MLKCWNIGEFVNTLYAKGTSDNILHSKIYIDLKIAYRKAGMLNGIQTTIFN